MIKISLLARGYFFRYAEPVRNANGKEDEMHGKFFKIILVFVIAISLGTASFEAPAEKQETITHLTDPEIYEMLKKFALVFQVARESYVEDVDEKKVLEGAINGMLESLDPHSSYLSEEDFKSFNEKSTGQFDGLGIQITADKGMIRVISPIDDTPAEKAGIKSGDYITHINGEQVGGITLNEAIKKMKGKPGSKVKLTIVQPCKEPKTITLKRAVIKVKSVKFDEIGETKDVGYIRISDFGAATTKELNEAIEKLEKKKVKGYVLDVRNNPGGYLTAAVNVSDAFLDGGEIVSVRGRETEDIERSMAKSGDLTGGKPLVVLVNHGSASASEIVAGAIQDNNRGIIMGSQTFGKGSVQQQRPLGDGTAIHITIARYYTPSGNSIQGKGITPDVEVLQSKVEVLEKKKDIFSESTLINALKNDKEADKKDKADIDDESSLKDEDSKQDYQKDRAIDMIHALAKIDERAKTMSDEKSEDIKNVDKKSADDKSDVKKDSSDEKKSDVPSDANDLERGVVKSSEDSK